MYGGNKKKDPIGEWQRKINRKYPTAVTDKTEMNETQLKWKRKLNEKTNLKDPLIKQK